MTTATVGAKVTTFAYDGDGRRATKTYDGLTTTYVDDVAGLPKVLEDGGKKYVYGIGLAYTIQTIDGVEYSGSYHSDGLGSVRAISDSVGAIIQTHRSDEFGVPLEDAGKVTQPFQYTGEERDETGLVFLRARYYEPGMGRFMGRDRWAGRYTIPQSLNRYNYALNNPLNLTDPSGLKSLSDTLIGAMETVTPSPFSALNATDMFGKTVGDMLIAMGGGTIRQGPQGTLLYENLGGGLVDFFREKAGWPPGTPFAVTLGHVILVNAQFNEWTQDGARWLAHEMGHVRQAEIFGDLYLPEYLYLLATIDYENHPWEDAADVYSERHWEDYYRPTGAPLMPVI